LNKINKESEGYIQDLEEKIVELSFKLKQKNNQLKSTNTEHEKVMGKMIHNLKNPVGVILSFSEMLFENIDDFSPEKVSKFLKVIQDSSKFSIDFLNSIAKLTQIKSTDFKLSLEQINYVNLINEVIEKLTTKADSKNITIVKKCINNDLFLNADANEISVAIYNVLVNAIRFSPANSTIYLSIQEKENVIKTIIKDEGVGISNENSTHVFEEFFVVNTYDEEKNKCIGLGLTVSKKIIDLHLGKITIKSALSKGSEFTIYLPK